MNKELWTINNEPKESTFSIQGLACLSGSKIFQKED
jgi:hypothetical protein